MPKPEKNKQDQPASEPWEVEYVHHELPTYPEAEVTRVLDECKKELHGSEDRNKLVTCTRKKLT
ncbi:MAG: hypothetical protein JWM68_857 [Verrucomicrobiales bacterium]|nr:hypothetical protein [Verrucomicrobiales bacterium]